MKFRIHNFIFLLLICMLYACEQPYLIDDSASSGSPADNPNGNLTVSVFSIEQTPFSEITRTAPADACTRLNFAIYDASGSKAKQINQTSAEADFGTASFQLEEGTYRLVVVAHSSNGNPSMTDLTKIQFTNAQGYSDTFLYSENITVGSEPQNLSVSLNRIVALCRFVITDDIPATVAKMRFYYTGGSGAFNAVTGFGSVNSKQDVKFDVASSQKQFDLYTFLHDIEGTIHLTVSALDASGVEITQHEFEVPLEKNQISWLSGDFFGRGASQSSSVGVGINTKWDGETHYTY